MLSTVLLYFTFVKGGLRSLFLDKGWFYYKKTHTGANGPWLRKNPITWKSFQGPFPFGVKQGFREESG